MCVCACSFDKALEAYKQAAEKNPDSRDCSNKVKLLTRLVQKQKIRAENERKKKQQEQASG